jgi:hypothetical protein
MDGRIRATTANGTPPTRNTPTIYNVGLSAYFNWDGIADTLEAHAELVLHSPSLMNITWPELLARLAADESYVSGFRAAYPGGLTRPNVLDALAQLRTVARDAGLPVRSLPARRARRPHRVGAVRVRALRRPPLCAAGPAWSCSRTGWWKPSPISMSRRRSRSSASSAASGNARRSSSGSRTATGSMRSPTRPRRRRCIACAAMGSGPSACTPRCVGRSRT